MTTKEMSLLYDVHRELKNGKRINSKQLTEAIPLYKNVIAFFVAVNEPDYASIATKLQHNLEAMELYASKQDLWHKGIGTNKHGENINLCGRPGAATNVRKHITCNKCRAKMHMKKI